MPFRLGGANYLEFLEEDLPVELDELGLPEEIRNNIIYMHDGAPAHTAGMVRQHLNDTFQEWIGLNGPILWPARSPDFNPMDFFLWGYIKNLVYVQSVENRDDTWQLIQDAFRTITPQMLLDTVRDVQRRAEFCIRHEGQHFEQYPHDMQP